MQKLATYLFSAELDEKEIKERLIFINKNIEAWLERKGVKNPSQYQGKFTPLFGEGEGNYLKSTTKSESGSILSINLSEEAKDNKIFITEIKIAHDKNSMFLYSTLSTYSESNVISFSNIYPKCPGPIRDIIEKYDDWKISGQKLPNGEIFEANSEHSAIKICDEIMSTKRNTPYIVISTDKDEEVWKDLPKELSRDLIGIAQVVSIDEIGSWTMTEKLGKLDSCYLGAVRLYWPKVDLGTQSPRGTVWTANQLAEKFGRHQDGMKRFQSDLRSTLMSAAASALNLPNKIIEIQVSSIKERIIKDRNNAIESALEKELDSFAMENYNIKKELENEKTKTSELESKIFHLERKIESSVILEEKHIDQEKTKEIKEGDEIFYKKIGNNGGIDIIVRADCCKHKKKAWSPAFKGDKAEKAIAKLEGRDNWKSIWHCGSCTGGGRWRVHW